MRVVMAGVDHSAVAAVRSAFAEGVAALLLHPRLPEAEAARRVAVAGHAAGRIRNGRDPDATAFVVFTSGSSGPARPVSIPRRAFEAAASAASDVMPVRADDRLLLAIPLAHVGGLATLARADLAGAALVPTSAAGDARALLDVVRDERITHASIVPTSLVRLVRRAERAPTSLRHLVVGGAACPDALASAAVSLGYPVKRTYGLSETTAMIALESEPLEGGVGRPLRGVHVRIVDGCIAVRTPTASAGYLDDGQPMELDPDGFLRTRDAGAVDAAGRLHVRGRIDAVIVRGGENVHPEEVEAPFLALEGVEGCVAVGLSDPEWGEVVGLAYVGSPGEGAIARARASLPPYARPAVLLTVAALPLLGNGKVDRRAARGLFERVQR